MKFGFITQVVTPTAESSYNFHMVTLSNKVVRMISSSKVEKDKLKNVTVNSSCVYDVYSNVTKETSVYSDGLTITTDNSYQNIDNGTTYRIGLLYDQVTTKTKDGLTWVGRNSIPVFEKLLLNHTKGIRPVKTPSPPRNKALPSSVNFQRNPKRGDHKGVLLSLRLV